jgi:hypothetical protein
MLLEAIDACLAHACLSQPVALHIALLPTTQLQGSCNDHMYHLCMQSSVAGLHAAVWLYSELQQCWDCQPGNHVSFSSTLACALIAVWVHSLPNQHTLPSRCSQVHPLEGRESLACCCCCCCTFSTSTPFPPLPQAQGCPEAVSA